MGKYNPDQLLALASRFQKLAETFPSDLPGDTLMRRITSLTGIKPTDEEWKRWLDTNRTTIGAVANKYWESNDHRSIYTPLGQYAAYISTDAEKPYPNFSRQSFATLRASPPLPALWLQVGETEYETTPSLPPELGHYEWLVNGISQILGGYSKRELAEFLVKNRSKIDRVRRSFETQTPKYLGGGADGAAFDIGGGKVLKIFRDNISYEKALLAFDRLHKSPELAKTEAMIYDVGALGRLGGDPSDPQSGNIVYYYIIETMKTIRDIFGEWSNIPLRRILEFIAGRIDIIKGSKLKSLKKDINDPTKAILIRKVVKEESVKLASDIKSEASLRRDVYRMEESIPTLKANWLELYVEEVIMKYLTGRTDLHMGNIGVTHYGELRYFDPAYGGHESEINT